MVVVKVEFDEVEARWRRQPGPSLITDAARESDADQPARLALPHRGTAACREGPLPRRRPTRPGTAASGGPAEPLVIVDDDRRYVAAQTTISIPGWHLRHLEPLDPFQVSPAARARELLLAAAGLIAIVLGLAVRAYESSCSNATAASGSRRRSNGAPPSWSAPTGNCGSSRPSASSPTNNCARHARKLAQANRLGIIGQITAGVAHEVNRPVMPDPHLRHENAIRQIERNTSRRGFAQPRPTSSA